MTDDLLRWREEFPILQRSVYMISNSLGAMPRGVRDRMKEFTDLWAERGIRAWSDAWWEMPVTVGNTVARILGAAAGSVTMHQNVAIAQQVILSMIDVTPKRNGIVYSSLEFPSIMYIYEAQARRGARITVVPSEDGIGVDTQRIVDAIDERTLLVPISLVLFKSAWIMDAAAICEKAAKVGAHVILDCYQAAGTVPIDLTRLGASFAVGGSVKWLCGGPGAGYLYVRPDLAPSLAPVMTGWAAHAEPFAFEPGPIRYAGGAAKFLNGSPHVPALYSCRAGYDIILEIGVDRIREKSVHQTARLIEGARARGWAVTAPEDPARRGGTVALAVPEALAVSKELIRRNFLVDYRPGAGIRVSPHFYTSDDEVDRTLDEIARIIDTRASESHLEARTGAF